MSQTIPALKQNFTIIGNTVESSRGDIKLFVKKKIQSTALKIVKHKLDIGDLGNLELEASLGLADPSSSYEYRQQVLT